MRRLALAAAVWIAVTASWNAAAAEDCAPFPSNHIRPLLICDDIGDGICAADKPIQFRAVFDESPATPLPSCVSVTWGILNGAAIVGPFVTTKGSESFNRTLGPGSYRIAFDIQSGSGTYYLNHDFRVARGWIQFSGPRDLPVDEGTVFTLTLTRTRADLSTVVDWQAYVPPGLPTAELTPSSGTLTLQAGELSKQFSIATPPNDSTFGGNKDYFIGITATNDYIVLGGTKHVVVFDNDVGFLETASSMTVREDAGTATITVQRTGNLAPAGYVRYATSGPGLGPVAGELGFAPGETSKSFSVPVIDDQLWSPDPVGTVSLFNPSPAVRIRTPAVSVHIQDNEPVPVLSAAGASSVETDSGQRGGAFTVKMSAPVTAFDVQYELVDGSAQFSSDYIGAQSGVLHFDATHSELAVPFQIIGDTAAEGNESLRLHLSRVSSYASQIAIPPDATFTILNDDAGLTPLSAQLARGEVMRYTLDLGLAAASATTIPLSVSDSAILSLPASVQISAGQSRATFNVTAREPGSARISARLPGGRSLTSFVTVQDSGTGEPSPAIASIEPAAGSAAGGTPFIARGSLLTADCTLLFGGAAAKTITLTSDGMLSGATTPHAPGIVDVLLVCGSETFVLTNAFTYTAPSRVRSARH
jgi:hypothetical protein